MHPSSLLSRCLLTSLATGRRALLLFIMSGKVQPNDLQGLFTYSNQQNYTHLTLLSAEASFCRGEVGERKKRERAGDDGKGNEMNIDYIQYSSEIRRHLEMHYRAEERLPHFDVFKSTLTCTLIKDCYKVKPCLVLLTI